MPAPTLKSARFWRLIRGIQKGDVDPKTVSAKARKVAKDAKPSDVKDYASTKDKDIKTKSKSMKKEVMADGAIHELFVVKMAHPGCTPDSLVAPIDPLNGISGTEITPDQVHGVYPSADMANMIAEKVCMEYEEGVKMLEEKKGNTTEKLKKAIDKLEKKRKEHMDAAKEDPKNASEHKTAIADLATKIDDYITKLEKIEKSKKEIEKKDDKKEKK
jgi:hypothetical protein